MQLYQIMQKLAQAGIELSLVTSLGGNADPAQGKSVIVPEAAPSHHPVKVTEPNVSEDVRAWRAKHRDQCLAPGEEPKNKTEELLKQIDGYIRESYFGRALLQQTGRLGYHFCDINVFDNVSQNTIGRNNDYYRANSTRLDPQGRVLTNDLRTAVHEWRHSWQGQETVFSDLTSGPHPAVDAVTKSWMREADSVAISVLFAWDIGRHGHPEVWNDMLNDNTHGDMAKAFQAVIAKSRTAEPTSGQIAKATNAAFRAWFTSDFLKDNYYTSAVKYSNPEGSAFDPAPADVVQFGVIPGLGTQSYLDKSDLDYVRKIATEKHVRELSPIQKIRDILPPNASVTVARPAAQGRM